MDYVGHCFHQQQRKKKRTPTNTSIFVITVKNKSISVNTFLVKGVILNIINKIIIINATHQLILPVCTSKVYNILSIRKALACA